MTFALFPLALISLYQTQAVVNEAETLSRTALLAETQRAVRNERELLQEAYGAAQALGAAVLSTRDDPETCRSVMREFVEGHPKFVFAGYIGPDGVMECASRGDAVDFSTSPDWEAASEDPSIQLQANPRGAVTGAPVLIASQPVNTDEGFQGYISISIPHTLADYLLPEASLFGDFHVATINARGDILTASGGASNASGFLPRNLSPEDIFARHGKVFDAMSTGGERRKYAVIPVFEGRVHAIGSWPINASQPGARSINASAPLAFPLLMWLVGIAVAWLGMHNLVIRHIHTLRDAMRRFALGERGAPPLKLKNPPEELAQTARAFNRMVAILTDSEQRREADLHDKTVLLREVHHRVKNNLQLIASITNMQLRQVETPEAKRVLSQLQRRVRGLATIHQSLYSTPDLTKVDAAQLVDNMVNQMDLIAGRTDVAPRVHTDLQSAMLYPDQAVPLSMLLAEALTNAWKYTAADDGKQPEVRVRLFCDADGMLNLWVRNSRSPGKMALPEEGNGDDADATGLGTRLMAAFIVQLEGTSEVSDTPDHYEFRLRFKPAEFSDDTNGN
ncbi:histidine kinase dimerization/phosphoacceptor domain -containing protein [Pseudaestuariivita atlantica]|uniref:histidine kinase dimerization/phosphoacceptor domain -containing protein n=1 Tax=Pseudaestuariivita atlantica TaxID=1317121 RepID=UPI0013F3D1C3|nr:histidine kinase dimerization/phosphoacceptor domain -containing protein [Pseudaestuariivita atlantica]